MGQRWLWTTQFRGMTLSFYLYEYLPGYRTVTPSRTICSDTDCELIITERLGIMFFIFFFLCVCTCVCVPAYTRVHWAGVYVHIHIHIVACACIYARVAEVALRCCSWGTIYLVFRDGLSFRLGWLTNEPKSHLTPPPKSMLSLECWRLNSSSHAIVSVLMPVIVWNKRGMIIIVFSFLCPML